MIPLGWSIACYARQRCDRKVTMDKGLGLVSLELPGIIGITLEIPVPENPPVNPIETPQVAFIIGRFQVSMPFGEDEDDTVSSQLTEGRHQDHDVRHRPLAHPVITCLDV